MSERTCPYCKCALRYGVRLPRVKARLFDIIARAGPDGIQTADIIDICSDRVIKPTTLHSHIQQMNQMLAQSGIKIAGTYGGGFTAGYRLIRRRK